MSAARCGSAADELRRALDDLDPAVRAGLEVAIANVHAVAIAGRDDEREVLLPAGQVIRLREVPVRRAAIYVPGGRAPYPSTVVMGVVTARAAGVEEVVVCAPGAHPVILAACALCEADAVFRMGGAHAVAALAYGTESVPRADVIAGPGNLYVQEAKRLVSGDVGHRRLRRARPTCSCWPPRAPTRRSSPSTSPRRPSTARAPSCAR